MYELNRTKTKIVIQKLINRLESEFKSAYTGSVLGSILGEYDIKRAELYGEANIYDSDKDIQIIKWVNINVDTLPKSYERYIVLSSLIRGRYTEIAKLESEILNDYASVETKFTNVKISLIEDVCEGTYKIRMPMLKANNKKNPNFYINYEILDTLDDFRFEKHNTALIDNVVERNDINLTKEQVITILKAMERVVVAINKHRYPPSLEDLRTFEYFTGIPIEKLYKPKYIEIKISLNKINLAEESDMLVNLYNLAENKRSAINSIMRELSCRITKITTRLIQTNRDDKYGFIIFDNKNNVFFSDCEYDFVVESNSKVILGEKKFLKEIDIDEIPEISSYRGITNGQSFARCAGSEMNYTFLKNIDGIANLVSLMEMRKGSCVVLPDNEAYQIIFYNDEEERMALLTTNVYAQENTGLIHLVSYGEEKQPQFGLLGEDFCLPPIYEEKISVYGELYKVSKNNQYGLVDKQNCIIIPIEYTNLSQISEGLIAAQKDEKFGYIDIENNTVIPFIFNAAYNFSEGKATVRLNGKECVINNRGDVLFEFDCDAIYKYSEGYAVFKLVNDKSSDICKYGYLDERGNVKVPAEYDEAASVKNGQAQVVKDNNIINIKLSD